MKKIIFSVILYFTFYISSHAQTDYLEYTLKTPDVSGIMEISTSPEINEATGEPNISIPLYAINLDNFNWPITLKYNVNNTKVEYESSEVGNSWSLITTGLISRTKNGKVDEFDDFAWSTGAGYDPATNQDLIFYCSLLYLKEDTGWFLNADQILSRSNYFKQNDGDMSGYNGPEILNGSDRSPDVFNYSLPNGISGSFIFKNASQIVNSGGEKIYYTLNSDGIIDAFEIVDLAGNGYFFEEVSLTGREFVESKHPFWSNNGNLGKPSFVSIAGFYDEPCPEGNSPGLNSKPGSIAQFNKPYGNSWYLTKIIINEDQSRDEIEFSYQDVDHVSLLNTVVTLREGTHAQNSNAQNYIQSKVLNSIEWKNGKINFIEKTQVREDVLTTGSTFNDKYSHLKALDRIEIYDNHNTLIRQVNFNTSYNEALNIQNETNNDFVYLYKRLWLDGITINNFSNSLQSYSFEYNPIKLPARLSFEQDYWGFYNGNGTDTDDNTSIPNLWFYPDDNRSITRPSAFSIFRRTNYVGQEMQVSEYHPSYNFSNRNATESSKAGVLQKITYPTGGTVEYEYELNSFMIEDQLISGPGIRVESITSNPIEGENVVTHFKYLDDQGFTSGYIDELPNFGNLISVINSDKKYELTSNNSSGSIFYRFVEKEITGGGKIKTEFLVPYTAESSLGLYSPVHQQYFYEKNYDISNFQIQTGVGFVFGPNIYEYDNPPKSLNYNSLFGKIIERTYVDNNNITKKIDTYSYDFSLNSERIFFLSETLNGDKLNTVFIGDLLLTNQSSYLFNDSSNPILESISYDYADDYPLLKEQKRFGSNQIEYLTKYFYPFDIEVSGMPYLNDLVNQNRVAKFIKQESYVDGEIVEISQIEYDDFDTTSVNDVVLPKVIQVGKSLNTLEENMRIEKRDTEGNIQEYVTRNGINVSVIWGYNKTYPIAEIKGATYTEVDDWLFSNYGQHITYLQNLSNIDTNSSTEDNLRVWLNYLRLSADIENINSQIDTYTYDPLVGMTSHTDFRNYTIYYRYDDFQRLKKVLDADGKVIRVYDYNYIHKVSSDIDTGSEVYFNNVNTNPFSGQTTMQLNGVPGAVIGLTLSANGAISSMNGSGGVSNIGGANATIPVGTSESFSVTIPESGYLNAFVVFYKSNTGSDNDCGGIATLSIDSTTIGNVGGSSPGTMVQVTDVDNSCTVIEPEPLNITMSGFEGQVEGTSPNCIVSYSPQVNVSGGSGNYTYSWQYKRSNSSTWVAAGTGSSMTILSYNLGTSVFCNPTSVGILFRCTVDDGQGSVDTYTSSSISAICDCNPN